MSRDLLSSTFFRRLFLPYLLLICAAVGIVALVGARRLRATYIAKTEQSLRESSFLVSEIIHDDLAAGRLAELSARIRQFGNPLHYRITVIRRDGKVIADNEADPTHMDDHRSRPEVAAAIAHGEGVSVRTSDTIHTDLMYFARRIGSGDSTHIVRVSVHLSELDRALTTLYTASAITALLAIAGAAALGFYFARRRTAPIVELTEFADAIAHGDLSRRVLRRNSGEVGTLTTSLNSMAESIGRLVAQRETDKSELLTILSSMSDGVIAIDADQRILLCNDAAASLLALEKQDVAGKMLWEVVRNDSVLRAVGELLATPQKKMFQIGPVSGKHLEITACPIPSSGLVLVVHDTTESVRYQDLRTEFVANVSHELRTPLTAIKGFAETLRGGAVNDPAAAQRFLTTIEKHADQLTNLVNDLLELSHLESDELGGQHVHVDLQSVIHKAVDLLAPIAQKKRQSLTAKSDGRVPPTLLGNPEYLERAVANLVDNAIKYTPEGGSIAVNLRVEDDTAVIEVRDSGIGIPAGDLPRIFERFYRVDRSRSREMGGTGLGLSIVKHVVQAHGGKVEAQSEVGRGSTFRLKLPLQNGHR